MDKGNDLATGSRRLKDESKKLKLSLYFRQYMTPILICVVLMLFILAKMYLF